MVLMTNESKIERGGAAPKLVQGWHESTKSVPCLDWSIHSNTWRSSYQHSAVSRLTHDDSQA